MPTAWRDRVVERGQVDPRDLQANPRNWRLHPESQRRPLRASLSSIGWVTYGALINRRLVENGWDVDDSGDYLVDGHARVEEAIDADQAEVPFTTVCLSPSEEAQILATLDPIAALAQGDAGVFDDLIAGIRGAHPDLDALMLGTRDELRALEELGGEDFDLDGAGSAVAPEELEKDDDRALQLDARRKELRAKWGVEPGQLWVIPSTTLEGRSHRVVCGDCREAGVLRRATGGIMADLCVTDPPYNVGLVYAYDAEGRAVENDAQAAGDYAKWTVQWLERWRPAAGRLIVTPGAYNLGMWYGLYGLVPEIAFCAPWIKTNCTTHGVVARFFCWEPILFLGTGWDRSRANDVFNFPIGRQMAEGLGAITDLHRCPKPLGLWCDLIQSYTTVGGVVHDPFLGSGTTLVAAERLSRVALTSEIDPESVAVALERAAGLGLAPRLADAE